MKQPLILILFILVIDFSFQYCANPGRPTGGPKDTIPPTLIYASPINGTTNFQGKTIELEFSEYVNADKLKQQLIITPNTNIQYKSIIKRNRLILKLDGDLEDSTTYNFNFANGLTDITEKNPAVNLSIAFSTGPYIDSMSVKGSVEDLLTKEPGKGYVVGLYPFSDSLDYFTDKPMYFATANDSGNYQLNYIKKGKYKIISFDDDNGNYLLDPATESHGFLSDTIQLNSATELNTIRCVLQNVKPITLINARPTGRYVEIKFNKMINSYTLRPTDIPSNIIGENNDIIRLYKTPSYNYGDSITSYIQSRDSLGNLANDTIKYVFLESNRKPSGFSYSFSENKIETVDQPSLKIVFNKPIQVFDSTKLFIKADSVLTFFPSFIQNWNQNRTQLDLILKTTTVQFDSIEQVLTKLDSITSDTTKADSKKGNKSPQHSLELASIKGAFVSVEQDSSENKSIPIQKPRQISSGILKIKLTTDLTNFRFQLLDSNDKVAYEKRNQKDFSFNAVKAAKYRIRILIDTNNDGKWSYGNLLENKEPEQVFLYGEEISIRENWEVKLDIAI